MPRSIKRRGAPDSGFRPDGLHPVLGRVYAARNITGMHELEYTLGGLPDYRRLHGIETAVDLLQEVLEGKKRILARDWANGARLKPGDSFDD